MDPKTSFASIKWVREFVVGIIESECVLWVKARDSCGFAETQIITINYLSTGSVYLWCVFKCVRRVVLLAGLGYPQGCQHLSLKKWLEVTKRRYSLKIAVQFYYFYDNHLNRFLKEGHFALV